MSSQDNSDLHDALKEQQIRNYVGTFIRGSLAPVHPLHQLDAANAVGHNQYTTIRRYRSQVTVPVGTTGFLEIPTVLLHLTLPQRIFNCHALGSIHVPLVMWSDGGPTLTSRSLGDNRVADLQIGDSEVRSAIIYYLIAWWRAFQRGVDPSAENPLFGQILLRQFATRMTERLRYFVVEVPRELWQVDVDILSNTPIIWDSEKHNTHQSRYRGPLGRFYCLSDGSQISLLFEVEFELPNSPSIFWRTTMDLLNRNGDVEDVRSEVIAEIFLEADPPVQLRWPQDSQLDPPNLANGFIPTSDT